MFNFKESMSEALFFTFSSSAHHAQRQVGEKLSVALPRARARGVSKLSARLFVASFQNARRMRAKRICKHRSVLGSSVGLLNKRDPAMSLQIQIKVQVKVYKSNQLNLRTTFK